MNVKVPLWGVLLTSFSMLFAVAFQQLGFTGAIFLFLFLLGVFFWALFAFSAYVAFLSALASGVATFLDGLKKVPETKYQWHFVNCLLLSSVLIAVGIGLGKLSSHIRGISPILSMMVEDPFADFSFCDLYIAALLVSICLRFVKKNWFASW